MLPAAIVLFSTLVGAQPPQGSSSAPKDAPSALECGYKKLAYAQAQKMQPWANLEAVFESLSMQECGETFAPPAPAPSSSSSSSAPVLADGTVAYYVCGAHGHDAAGDGSIERPFKSLHRAVLTLRKIKGKGKTIVLKPGNHYLGGGNGTIELGAEDSGLTITSAGDAWLSGGMHIGGLEWTKSSDGPSGAWTTSLSAFK